MDVLPRHGHGPGEQVIDGRLIIQGINSLSARDVYTGRVLWKREFEQLRKDNWMVFTMKPMMRRTPSTRNTTRFTCPVPMHGAPTI